MSKIEEKIDTENGEMCLSLKRASLEMPNCTTYKSWERYNKDSRIITEVLSKLNRPDGLKDNEEIYLYEYHKGFLAAAGGAYVVNKNTKEIESSVNFWVS